MIRIIFIILSYLPPYHYSLPTFGRCWSSTSYFLYVHHIQKGSNSGEVRSLMPALTYPWWYTWLLVVHLRKGSSNGFYPDTFTIVEVLIWFISATQSGALPPIIEGSFICLYIILLVNEFHYRFLQKGKYNVRCKTFSYCKI